MSGGVHYLGFSAACYRLDQFLETHINPLFRKLPCLAMQYDSALKAKAELRKSIKNEGFCNNFTPLYLSYPVTKEQILRFVNDVEVSPMCWDEFNKIINQVDEKKQDDTRAGELFEYQKNYITEQAINYLKELDFYLTHRTYVASKKIIDEFYETVTTLLRYGYTAKEIEDRMIAGGVTNSNTLNKPRQWDKKSL